MKNQYDPAVYYAEKNRKFFGFRERTVYRLGVLMFYILLFFAISFVTRRVQLPNNEPGKQNIEIPAR